MTTDDVLKTLTDVIACADTWEPDARIVGNVRAADIRVACYRARAAVEFVRKYGSQYITDMESAGNCAEEYIAAAEAQIASVLGTEDAGT